MAKKLRYALRVAVLVLYGCYALSPIYLLVAAGDDDLRRDLCRPSQDYSMGIVWVNVLLSSLLEEGKGDATTSVKASLAQQDPDLILIKKKRAVFREQYAVTQPIDTIALSLDSTVKPLASFHEYEIPLDPQHRETNGYSSLHAGLSPPQHLS
jgi:hypothetical protein